MTRLIVMIAVTSKANLETSKAFTARTDTNFKANKYHPSWVATK